MSFAARVADAACDALRARGEAGEAALRGLRGGALPDGPLRDAVLAASRPPALVEPALTSHEALREVEAAGRLVIVGDLHGRWDVARATLERHGVIDAEGRWCAPARTVLVQMGDLLDADLRHRGLDADGLVEAFSEVVSETLDAVEGASADALRAGLAAEDFAERHAWIGACLVRQTVAAMRRLEVEARAAGGATWVLLGNHEVDLLSGRRWWATRQKQAWLTLEGVSPGADWREHEVLRWLAARPVVLRCGGALMMHGGPTRAATEALEAAEVTDIEALGAWLDARCGAPFTQGFLAEGRSILSPERSREDVASAPELVQAWLEATRCDWLVVGHSPFLGFPAGAWPDASAPEVAQRLGRIERLGVDGNVLAVDTNLKRGERCEALELRAALPEVLEPEGGRRALLSAGEVPPGWAVLAARRALLEAVDALRGPALIDLRPVGVPAEALSDVMSAPLLERSPGLRRDLGRVLRAGPGSLERVSSWLDAGDVEALRAHVEALNRRVARLGAALDGQGGGTLHFYADLRAGVVDGVRYRLIEAVLEAAWGRARVEGRRLRPAAAAQLVLEAGSPAVRVMVFRPGEPAACDEAVVELEGEELSWSALEGQALALLQGVDLEHLADATPAPRRRASATRVEPERVSGATSVGPVRCAREPRLPRRLAERWLELNRAELMARAPREGALSSSVEEALSGVELVASGEEASPGFFEVRGPWPRLRGLITADGVLTWADTTFVHPALRLTALSLGDGEAVPQTEALWSRWAPPETIVLHSQLKDAVLQRLRAGEMEQLRVTRSGGGWAWDAGCFVFTSPSRRAASRFAALNPREVTLRLPRARVRRLLERGLLSLSVMLDDAGVELGAPDWLGEPSAALEVIGVGSEGVRALWDHRVEPKKTPSVGEGV